MQKQSIIGVFTGLCLICAGGGRWAHAQTTSDAPKVLVIQVEELKPGKTGEIHLKSEDAFVKAMKEAKSKDYYLAMTSMSGSSRAAFLFGYDSLEDWEKTRTDEGSNAPLASAIDSATLADGELQSDYLTAVYRLRPDMSYGTAPTNIAHMRYFDVGRYKVKVGREAEFAEAVKMWGAAMGKLDPDLQWYTYQSMLGKENGGVYLFFTPMKSLSTLDQIYGRLDKLSEDANAKRMAELFASSEESHQHNLYKFDPRMSYPSPVWAKADAFWQTK